MSRTFHIGDLLSVTTGYFVCPSGDFGDLYEILNYLTGDDLYTHVLPRAAEVAGPYLLEKFPELAEIEPPEFKSPEEVDPWLVRMVELYGETREVEPMPEGRWTYRDPIAELVEMMN